MAARLRQRKGALLRRLTVPPEGLPGSLALTYRRCGKPTCHGATGQGHPLWSLTFMVEGQKHVERIPEEWVDAVRQRVEAGRAFKAAVADVFAAYFARPGDGRQRPQILAGPLLWAPLVGQVLRVRSFQAIEAFVHSPARRALGVSRRFGDEAFADFTERLDPAGARTGRAPREAQHGV